MFCIYILSGKYSSQIKKDFYFSVNTAQVTGSELNEFVSSITSLHNTGSKTPGSASRPSGKYR